jgi:hypothetical protein
VAPNAPTIFDLRVPPCCVLESGIHLNIVIVEIVAPVAIRFDFVATWASFERVRFGDLVFIVLRVVSSVISAKIDVR